MKFTASKKEVEFVLKQGKHVAEKRSTMPILEAVLIEVESNRARFNFTDLQRTMRTAVDASATQDGGVCVSTNQLLKIIKAIKTDTLTFFTEDDNVKISADGVVYTLETSFPQEEFPPMPDGHVEHLFTLDSDDIKEFQDKIVLFASLEDTRYNLECVCFDMEKGRVVATDGNRLAEMKGIIPTADKQILINRSHMGTFVNLVRDLTKKSTQCVYVGQSGKDIFFNMGRWEYIARQPEGEYPDVDRVIPYENGGEFAVNREDLLKAVKKLNPISDSKTHGMIFTVNQDGLKIETSNCEIGSAVTNLLAVTNTEIRVGYNGKYIQDSLEAMKSQDVSFHVKGPLDSARVTPLEGGNYLNVIMPMRI